MWGRRTDNRVRRYDRRPVRVRRYGLAEPVVRPTGCPIASPTGKFGKIGEQNRAFAELVGPGERLKLGASRIIKERCPAAHSRSRWGQENRTVIYVCRSNSNASAAATFGRLPARPLRRLYRVEDPEHPLDGEGGRPRDGSGDIGGQRAGVSARDRGGRAALGGCAGRRISGCMGHVHSTDPGTALGSVASAAAGPTASNRASNATSRPFARS